MAGGKIQLKAGQELKLVTDYSFKAHADVPWHVYGSIQMPSPHWSGRRDNLGGVVPAVAHSSQARQSPFVVLMTPLQGSIILAADGSLSLKVKSCGSDHVITEAGLLVSCLSSGSQCLQGDERHRHG